MEGHLFIASGDYNLMPSPFPRLNSMFEEMHVSGMINVKQNSHLSELLLLDGNLRGTISKERVDKRCDGRALRKQDQQTKHEQEKDHGRQPPQFMFPKKL